jgi:PIN domain nuclease of toxin-antitoxin system
VFIWSVSAPARLDQQARAAVAAPDNRVFVSAVTAWEIAIKHALGRLKFPIERFDDIMLRMGFDALPILPAHAIAAGALPRHHDDPFDRMLIAQARIERLQLVSSNQAVVGATMFRSEGDLDDEAGAFDGADGAFSVRRSGVQEGKQGSTQITRSKGTDYTDNRFWALRARSLAQAARSASTYFLCNLCP